MAAQDSTETVHATSVAIGGRGILLCGASGAGKSDLALRLIDRGAMLISDDYTIVERNGGQLTASAPATIAGKMEVRGLGVVDMPFVGEAPLALVVDLAQHVDRMPGDPDEWIIAGAPLPVIKLSPFEASAPIKVELALGAVRLA